MQRYERVLFSYIILLKYIPGSVVAKQTDLLLKNDI